MSKSLLISTSGSSRESRVTNLLLKLNNYGRIDKPTIMTNLEMKAIASNFYECYNRKDVEKTFHDFVALDLVNHTTEGKLTREKWLAFERAFLDACPDLELLIKDQFVGDDKVVTHWTCCGTHQEDFFGMEASGNSIRITAISIDRIENGKIKEHFTMTDFTQFMQQFTKDRSS